MPENGEWQGGTDKEGFLCGESGWGQLQLGRSRGTLSGKKLSYAGKW